MNFSTVVLAAGQGIRMQSALPKVLHPIGGIPIIERIISTISQLNPQQIIVIVGNQGEQLKNALADYPDVIFIEQKEQKGTGHAALQALPALNLSENVLLFYGDMPLILMETLQRLLAIPKDTLGLITESLVEPAGFGRIIRDQNGKVLRIVEEKDATIDEKKITETNAGFFRVPQQYLTKWLPKLTAHNTQKEYLLTDIVAMASADGVPITTVSPRYHWEALGINDKIQLANVERIFQRLQAEQLMRQGVTLHDPARFDVRGNVSVGRDVVIDVNVIFEGQVTLGNGVNIGPNVVLKNSIVHDDVDILANCVIEGAIIGKNCRIGPFARIRSGTELAEEARIGNFVEIKASTVGTGSKISHLSYIGDTTLGAGVNVGAGTITCNYDGQNKHKTIIGDKVFIGSNSQLIAPLTVGEGVTIGAGTTVTRDVPAHHLVHNRLEHRTIANWNNKKDEKK